MITNKQNHLESWAKEGDSPVGVDLLLCGSILSMAGHVKSCLKLPGPSGKAKYFQETDSEQVL
jgi:hypothetical protein